MNSPGGVSVDVSGNVFIIDYRKIRMVSNTGIITTVAGTGEYGSSVDGGAATSATLNWPTGISVDISGNLYIVETDTNKIRMVTSAGIITTFAGTGAIGNIGDGGAAISAQLNTPWGVSVDVSGNVYIADYGNNKIRKVISAGIISTFAGTGTAGSTGDVGAASSAQLNGPTGVSVDISGNVYIADSWNLKIRMVTSTGIITTFAGGGNGSGGDGDGGAATSARLDIFISMYNSYQSLKQTGVAVDISGNVYIAGYGSRKVRMISSTTGIITTFAGTGTYGDSGDGGAATSAHMDHLLGVAVDRSGNVYIADADNNKIRMVTRPRSSASAMPSSQPSHQPTIQPTSQVNQKRHHFIYL